MEFLINKNRERIVSTLNLRKVIDVKGIYEEINGEVSLQGVRNTLSKLEKSKLAKSFTLPGSKRKYYALNPKFQLNFGINALSVSQANLYHDLLLSKICSEFLKYEKVKNFYICGNVNEKEESLCPDAVVHIKNQKGVYKIAIEMEITPKQIKRYLRKFNLYDTTNEYDYVFYIFTGKGAYNSYKRELEANFNNLKNNKIILIRPELLSVDEIILSCSEVFAFGKVQEIERIIGEKKGK